MKATNLSKGLVVITSLFIFGQAAAQLKVVLIRHGEKPLKGDNLTCQGLNRALALPALLYTRFGLPEATYIPRMDQGASTQHSRMFQTIMPFAVKYNLTLTSTFEEADSAGIARDIGQCSGTVLVVWEHKRIPSIVRALGIKDDTLRWPDDDYDSIWILTLEGGAWKMTRDHEGLTPATGCAY